MPVPHMMMAIVAAALLMASPPAHAVDSAPAPEPVKVSGAIGPAEQDILTISIDVGEAPHLEPWARDAAHYAIKWYPTIAQFLAVEGISPSREIAFLFRSDAKNPGSRRGNSIIISVDWIEKHPDDLGMIAHELVHVIQDYPRGNPHWLVEGIADYIRYYMVEPGSKRAGFDPEKRTYAFGYQPAAGMLNWLEASTPGAVAQLHQAMRRGGYSDELLREIAGASADELWEQFKGSLASEQAAEQPQEAQ